MDRIKTQTDHDKDRLATLHEKVSTFSKEAGLATAATLSDDELQAKVSKPGVVTR